MTEIRYAKISDEASYLALDKHISCKTFREKIAKKECYVLMYDGAIVGVLRYGLFWDSIPFCNLIFISDDFRGKGLGKELMTYWEKEMRALGYGLVITSTQTDENAQYFYRKLGYKEGGCLILDVPEYAQPMEMFFVKSIK